MSKLRVIIGQGTANEVFRATLSNDDGYDNVILGPRGLWAVLPGGHRMGQTPHALQLPGQPVPAHSTASGQTPLGLQSFLDVNTYQQGLLALSQRNDRRQGTIREVIADKNRIQLDNVVATNVAAGFRDGQIRVTTNLPAVQFLADQVVIANGIGPQQRPAPPQGVHGVPNTGLGYPQLIEGIDYLNSPPPYGREVAVFGGSATAAWVADEAIRRSRKLLWFTRPGGSEFRGCTLPGDRNFIVLQNTANVRMLANLQRIDYLPEKRAAGRVLRRPMVKLTLQPQAGPAKICLVDQLIYSIGGDPAGQGSIMRLVDVALRAQLQPLRDSNRVISDGNGTIALATPNRSLIIIGAATYNYTTQAGDPAGVFAKQSAPMASLPRASQVPDGIAMIVASVETLNSSMPFTQDLNGRILSSNLNLNIGNRDQLAAYVALYYPDIGPAAANEIVVRAIALRSSKGQGREWGISEAELDNIIRQYL